MNKTSLFIDRLIKKIGDIVSYCNAFLIAVIVIQVFLRYGFGEGMVSLEELQWHFYAVIIMFGLSYSNAKNSHVRVDVLSSLFSLKAKALIEVFGIVFLLWPFLFLVIDYGIDFFYDSFKTMERSPSPGGLPYRWVIKLVIPLSFFLMLISSLGKALKNILLLFERKM